VPRSEQKKKFEGLVENIAKEKLDLYYYGRKSVEAHHEYAKLWEDAAKKAVGDAKKAEKENKQELKREHWKKAGEYYRNAAAAWTLLISRNFKTLRMTDDQFYDAWYNWAASRASMATANREGGDRLGLVYPDHSVTAQQILAFERLWPAHVWQREWPRYQSLLAQHSLLFEEYNRLRQPPSGSKR
jgi:hypothetical protein